MSWKPTQIDIVWSENLIRLTKQDGFWSTQDRRSVYQFDHRNKNLTTIRNDNSELHERVRIVFGHLGWSVDGFDGRVDPERN